jgi:fatty acid desaturase
MTNRDYSLVGASTQRAIETGLVAAEWYHTDIPRKVMKDLMQRSDAPAIRDTLIWFALLGGTAALTVALWGNWWVILPYFAYVTLYGSSTDSRWHECGHGTAFRTRWMNDAIYEMACFMIVREPVIWKWSHSRHHTDTIIVGRDPEIAVMKPAALIRILGNFIGLDHVPNAMRKIVMHAFGSLDADEKTYVPESEWPKVKRKARLWLALHLAPWIIAAATWSILPILLVGIVPSMLGSWFYMMVGLTQHGGLDDNVLDHRLNARTVYMNPVFRFLYWNMNYHIEHHMFPMVPYHALPRLHEIMKHDTPPPSTSTFAAYRELVPAVLRQLKNPDYRLVRSLPPTARPYRPDLHVDLALSPAE